MLKEKSLICFLISGLLIILAGLNNPTLKDMDAKTEIAGRRFWVLKTRGETLYDMILLGDSRVYRGVSPQKMETILKGYRIFNYGYSAGGLNNVIYQAAERRLDPASKKKTIILGVTPASLRLSSAQNAQYMEELNRPYDEVLLYRYFLPVVDFFSPVSPQYVIDTLSNMTQAAEKGDNEGYFVEFYDDGWVASWLIPEDPNRLLPHFNDMFQKTKVDNGLIEDLYEQTRAWRDEGISVFAFRVPSSVQMVELENKLSGFDEAAFADGFENAGGIWIDIPTEPYHSFDGSHLEKQSAIQLSLDLAHALEEYLK
jgi:hypothetical protein